MIEDKYVQEVRDRMAAHGINSVFIGNLTPQYDYLMVPTQILNAYESRLPMYILTTYKSKREAAPYDDIIYFVLIQTPLIIQKRTSSGVLLMSVSEIFTNKVAKFENNTLIPLSS